MTWSTISDELDRILELSEFDDEPDDDSWEEDSEFHHDDADG